MHQILTNPKIFKVVAKWLSAETHDPTERDFCALARTCRDLYEPAMDQAWRDLGNGIGPLLHCFPPGIMREEIDDDGSVQMVLDKLPTPNDWTRFQHHARRVECVNFARGRSISYGSDFDSRLLASWPFPRRQMLPRLRTIYCTERHYMGPGEWVVWDFIAKHRLQELYLVYEGLWPAQVAPSILRSRHSLRTLDHTGDSLFVPEGRNHAEQLQRIHNAISVCDNLVYVFVHFPVPSNALTHLSLLPNLKKLGFIHTFHLREGATQDPQLPAPGPSRFRALESLELLAVEETQNELRIIPFIQTISSPHWKSLRICFGNEPHVQSLKSLVEYLSTRRTLEKINLHADSDGEFYIHPGGDEWPIPASFFSPFHRLQGLRKFVIQNLPLSVHPTDIREIARSWPHLETLDLNGRDVLSESTLRAHDLQPLAASCPQLIWACLPLCVLDGQSMADPNRPPEHRGSLRRLIVVVGEEEELPDEELEHLQQMFPNLDVDAVQGDSDNDDGPRSFIVVDGSSMAERMDEEW